MTTDARQRWSSRKFWTAMIWSLVWTGLLVADYLSETTYRELMLVTLGAYFLANVWQKVKRLEAPK